jgi:hypothetical protein
MSTFKTETGVPLRGNEPVGFVVDAGKYRQGYALADKHAYQMDGTTYRDKASQRAVDSFLLGYTDRLNGRKSRY